MNAKSWYRSWFNSPYYHLLYRNRDEDEAAAFIDHILKYLHPSNDACFLDLACGKGRHSVYINKKGYRVTGVDLSEQNIASAKAFENENLEFAIHDMRKPFRENGFDYVLNLFTSFGYFFTLAENTEVLRASHKNLKPKGKILIDFLNINEVSRTLVAEQVLEIDGVKFKINREIENGLITKNIQVLEGGEIHTYHEQVQAFTKQDLTGMLITAKFEILDIFGNYNLDQFDPESSPRLIIVARKL